MAERDERAVPYRIVEVSGTSYQRGKAFGERVKELLPRFLEKEFYKRWPGDEEQMRKFGGQCYTMMEKYLPQAAEFVKGFSAATGLSEEEIAMIQAHEEFAHGITAPHCSIVAATPAETVTERVYLGQNWDWKTSMNEFKLLLRQKTENDLRILTYAFGGLWSGAGINSAGIALTWTSAFHPKPDIKGKAREGVPTYPIIAEVLEKKDLDEAVSLVMSCQNAGWFIFSLASSEGRLVKIEASPESKAVAYPRSFIATSGGSFQSEEVLASLGIDTLEELPAFQAAAARLAQLLVAYSGKLSPQLLLRFLASHLPSDVPGTICEHGVKHATLDSMLFSPSEGKCWFVPGPPCYHLPFEIEV